MTRKNISSLQKLRDYLKLAFNKLRLNYFFNLKLYQAVFVEALMETFEVITDPPLTPLFGG